MSDTYNPDEAEALEPEVLTLPLRFKDGLTLLGGQVLGPAPRLVQRQ